MSKSILATTRGWIWAHDDATASDEGEPAFILHLTTLLLSQPRLLVDVLMQLPNPANSDLSVVVDHQILAEQSCVCWGGTIAISTSGASTTSGASPRGCRPIGVLGGEFLLEILYLG